MKDFEVAHFSPGRLRVRMAQVVRDPAFAAQLTGVLSGVAGIRSVSANSLTGSVLVEYDPDGLDLQSLLSLGRMLNLIPDDFEVPGFFAAGEATESHAGVVASGVELIGQTLGSAIEQGGRVAVQALDPRVALSAVAFGTIAQRLGIGSAITASPALAAWLLVSALIGPAIRKSGALTDRPGST